LQKAVDAIKSLVLLLPHRNEIHFKRFKNMSNFSFALPPGYDWNVKKFTREVKTKKWVKTYSKQLAKWHCKLTNAKRDDRQIIGGILQAGYGYNIGNQILEKLTDNDLDKIRKNIIFS
jgi:hypothetical protein